MRISVLGCGRWGSFIAWYLNKIGHEVTTWGLEGDPFIEELIKTRKNEYVEYDKNIRLTTNLAESVDSAEVIIISISSQALSTFMKSFAKCNFQEKPIVLCMKGIECSTGKRLSEIVSSATNEPQNVAVWVGPGHIQCFTENIPNCMVIASENEEMAKMLVTNFKSDLIKFYRGRDVIGSEIGAAAKNVVGIAAGMLDGANLVTLKGALMARGAREVSRLIKAMGGDELTAYGLCHLGDYETTLFSPFSHNRRYGEAFIKGEKFDKLAEGVKTAEGLMLLAKKFSVDLPITSVVEQITSGKVEPMTALLNLFSRENEVEFY